MRRLVTFVVLPVLSSIIGLYDCGTWATGKTFYVDPVNGNMANDGSAANPWSTLQAVFNSGKISTSSSPSSLVPKNVSGPVKAGDTIKLLNGYHGRVAQSKYYNQDYITIEAAEGHSPKLGTFSLDGAQKWKIRGLTVSPELGGFNNGGGGTSILSFTGTGTRDVFLENNTVYDRASIAGWTVADWLGKRSYSGIQAYGSNFTIRNNTVRNTGFGINTFGSDTTVEHNLVENWSADGIRGGGDRLKFNYNTIRWGYQIDDNHNDGIQVYSGRGVTSNTAEFKGNFMLGYSDPTRPFSAGFEGIACFDGPYVNYTAENNVIMVEHYHGISFYDAQNSRIINNTVLNPDPSTENTFKTWIIFDKKLNLPTTGNNLSRNNIALTYINTTPGFTSDHNYPLTLANRSTTFVDWQHQNLRLKTGSGAIDYGSSLLAPMIDIDGVQRPFGARFDAGAYEYTTVPEPASAVLMVSVVAGYVLMHRRLRAARECSVHRAMFSRI